MGILKKARGDAAAQAAQTAIDEGHSIFVWSPGSSFSASNHGLGPLAEQIESIEACGWRLEHFATAWSTSMANHLIATCVFRLQP